MSRVLIRCGARALILRLEGGGFQLHTDNDVAALLPYGLELTRLEAHGLAFALALALADNPPPALEGGTILYDARAGCCKLVDRYGRATGWEVGVQPPAPNIGFGMPGAFGAPSDPQRDGSSPHLFPGEVGDTDPDLVIRLAGEFPDVEAVTPEGRAFLERYDAQPLSLEADAARNEAGALRAAAEAEGLDVEVQR